MTDADLRILCRHLQVPVSTVVAAPGRINLIGEHVDYNDGFVLPMAIDRQVVVASGIRKATSLCRVRSLQLDDEFELDSRSNTQDVEPGSWQAYIRGVIAGFLELGVEIPGFDAVIHSTLPLGSGLSSSAALEVAVATMLEQLTGQILEPVDKALLCHRAENEFVGVPCGVMDQFTSVFAEANNLLLLDCQTRQCRQIPFSNGDVSFLVANTNIKHQLSDSKYSERRSECDAAIQKIGKNSWREVTKADVEDQSAMPLNERLRAKHIVTEIERTLQAVKSLEHGDFEAFGKRMLQSHESLRDDFQVSCAELDALVEIASCIGLEGGIYGSRMTGGGFGGCTISLIETSQSDTIIRKMSKDYHANTGLELTCFMTRPSDGARALPKPVTA